MQATAVVEFFFCYCSKSDNAVHWMNFYPVDNAIGFVILFHWIMIYPVDRLSAIQQLNRRALIKIFLSSFIIAYIACVRFGLA